MQCEQQKPTIATAKFYSGVIQRVECLTVNQDVAGAEPATRAKEKEYKWIKTLKNF